MPEKLIEDSSKYKSLIEEYYKGQVVRALVELQVQANKGDEIAMKLSKLDNVKDVFLVTGEADIILKVSFERTEELMAFILKEVAKLSGVIDSKVLMILTSYKEMGRIVIEE
ncbi:MAG: Lrp/AsnC ligand binding domain-containing protein [Candidatus Thermoplasmatota archaeon]|jgi:DNA-binding Lrp family transcriptional regulator|nr:Lrp/AsnC ligand binding domain-containing protein [Candidatus Thermoplasmatota archaeon]MDP7264062.1 Lrp/AsnC ligand binding domain-containing protein [Candidatus Thermoplasmatota archaeon]